MVSSSPICRTRSLSLRPSRPTCIYPQVRRLSSSDPAEPVAANILTGPDRFTGPHAMAEAMDRVHRVLPAASFRVQAIFGREYSPVMQYRCEDAETGDRGSRLR